MFDALWKPVNCWPSLCLEIKFYIHRWHYRRIIIIHSNTYKANSVKALLRGQNQWTPIESFRGWKIKLATIYEAEFEALYVSQHEALFILCGPAKIWNSTTKINTRFSGVLRLFGQYSDFNDVPCLITHTFILLVYIECALNYIDDYNDAMGLLFSVYWKSAYTQHFIECKECSHNRMSVV